MEIQKLKINGVDVEEINGDIFINGRNIKTDKYQTSWLTWMFFIGAFSGMFLFMFLLIIFAALTKI